MGAVALHFQGEDTSCSSPKFIGFKVVDTRRKYQTLIWVSESIIYSMWPLRNGACSVRQNVRARVSLFLSRLGAGSVFCPVRRWFCARYCTHAGHFLCVLNANQCYCGYFTSWRTADACVYIMIKCQAFGLHSFSDNWGQATNKGLTLNVEYLYNPAGLENCC